MILCDREADWVLQKALLVIDPRPGPEFMASTAIDLRLGATLDVWSFDDPDPQVGDVPRRFRPGIKDFNFSEVERKYSRSIDITGGGYDLSNQPGKNFIRGWTLERLYLPHTSRLCARVEGKSSLGRMGVGVHVTAPTIHAGFGHNSQNPADHGACLRLEIWNVGPLPVELVPGMRICQLILEEVRETPSAGYQGQFNMQGPKPSA